MGFRGNHRNFLRDIEMCWNKALAIYKERENAADLSNLQQLQENYNQFQVMKGWIQRLRVKARALIIANDAFAMRERRNILMFINVPEDPDMHVMQTILDFIQVKMGIANVTSSSLERCQRLGIICNHARPILVQFRNHRTKVEVWISKSQLNGTSVVIVEYLTKLRRKIFVRACEHFGVRNVWTLDGIIHIKIPCGHAKVITKEQLDVLVVKHPMGAATVSSGSKCGASADVL